jgi:predicted porin
MNRHALARTSAAMLFPIALTAHAQGSDGAQVYGLIDLSIGRTQAPGRDAVRGVDNGKMTTSYLGFRAAEDLGDGLKANFALEGFLRADTGTTGRFDGDAFFARNAWAGLSGSLGSVAFGRITTSLFVQTLLFNPFGDSYGFSPSVRHWFTSGTTTGDSAWSDSVRYGSPRIGGFVFTLHGAAGEGNGGRNASASAQYASGPFGAAGVWQAVKKGAAVEDSTSWQAAASYDFTAVKLFVQYGEVDNDTKRIGYRIAGIGARVPVGAGQLLFQWGRIDPDAGAGAERSTVSLGYGHALSKRTDVYVAAMNDRIAGTGTGNSYSVGLRLRF